jgi:hypothetical protein
MRLTRTLVLALALPALALPALPAAAGAKGCSRAPGVTVVTPTGKTSSMATPGTPVAGSANGADTTAGFQLDLSSVKKAVSAPVRIQVSWGNAASNFDISVQDRFGFEYGRGTALNTASETVALPPLASCDEIVVVAKNTAGSPAESLSVKVTVGDVLTSTPRPAPALPRAGWVATGSQGPGDTGTLANGDPAENALDGKVSTRWSSRLLQNPSEFFQLDLAKPTSFSRVVLTTGPSPGDSPVEYTVAVSDDMLTWRTVAAGAGAYSTEPRFPQQTARYVKISLTGATFPNWWSIAEINVFKDPCFSKKAGC